VQSSLLRFQPVCVSEGSEEDDGMRFMTQGGLPFFGEPAVPAWMHACAALQNLRAVHLSLQQERKAVEIMKCLQTLPQLQSLRDLRISCHVLPRESATVADMLRQLASLPKLQALHFAGSWEKWLNARTGAESSGSTLDVSSLAVSSSLNDLTLDISSMIGSQTYLQLLQPVIERGVLRALSLHSPLFASDGELRAFLHHLGSRCAELRRLTLLKPRKPSERRHPPLSAAEWAGAFNFCTQLRHVTMSHVHPEVLLQALQPCTQLEEIHIQLVPELFGDAESNVSAHAAAETLVAMPQVRVVLHTPNRERFHADTTQRMQSWCRALEQLSCRVHVHDARQIDEQSV
jgi:hypothetical protein